jgi:uncharacterized protein (DUF1778 family)
MAIQGRPTKFDVAATEVVRFRATPQMKAAWTKAAKTRKLTLTEFMIEAANAFIARPRVDARSGREGGGHP